jgi:heme exporter protein C
MVAMNLHRFANPNRFLRISRRVAPVAGIAAAALIGLGLYLGLAVAPPDYQQGDSVRIMFVHVPSAWLAMLTYVVLAACGAALLVWRHPLAEVAQRAAAPVGAAFTLICLLTGSLWGKPSWGTWWVWDARLTSMLVLFFFYVGHIALSHAFDDEQRGARSAAVLALVGVVNLPIIKFSVDWWFTLHQPASVFRSGGSTIHSSLLTPLLVMALGFLCYFIAVFLLRIEAGLARRRLETQARLISQPR